MTFRVYTAIYGGYDTLKPHPPSDLADAWVCFTDDPQLTCSGWTVVYERPRFAHPRLAAKWRKCHPPIDPLEPLGDQLSLWVDGSVQVTNPDGLEVMRHLLGQAPIALCRHPVRNNIIDEAAASLAEQPAKYAGLDLDGQVAHYLTTRGEVEGLWASTIIGRRHTPTVLQLGAAWMAHCELGTVQDQLSLPVLLADYGIEPAEVPGGLWGNGWSAWLGHTRND